MYFSLICCAHINVRGQNVNDQHCTFPSYNNETQIRAAKSVTLTDGFYIPAGKTVRIFTGTSFEQVENQAGHPSSNQNYISTKIIKKEGVTNETVGHPRNVYEVSQTVQYFDGLGRLCRQ